MNDDLYFISLLIQAMESPNVRESLRKAFRKITIHAQEPRFSRSYTQFLAFMEAVKIAIDCETPEKDQSVLENEGQVSTAIEPDNETILNILEEFPELQPLWAMMEEDNKEISLEDIPLELILHSPGAAPITLCLAHPYHPIRVEPILPGTHELTLASGRMLWKDNLTEADLLWSYVKPDKPMRLAAGISDETVTRQTCVFDGNIIIRVCAGRTFGRLEIEVCIK